MDEEVQAYNSFIRRLSEIIIKVHSTVGDERFADQCDDLSNDEKKEHCSKES